MDKRMKGSVLALAVAGALGLAACGGGGSSDGSTTTTDTTTSGVITGFGSVYVNGVEYETGGSSVSVDGASATEDDLEVGMVVTLEGSVNADGTTGHAINIQYADDIEGVVLSNSIQAGSSQGVINIMGQNVSVSADTVFDSDDPSVTGVDQLTTNYVVEVSGYPSGNGSIYATRIELKGAYTPGQELEVKGIVGNLDDAAKTFRLGDLSVDYSGATEVPAELGNSLYVEVTTDGVPQETSAGSGTYSLVATRVEVEDDGSYGHDGAEGEEFEMQGVVTATAADHFMLNGRKVLLGEVEGDDFDPTALAEGQTVRVEAHFNADGDLVAEEIEFGAEGELEFEGVVDAVDASGLTVFGQPIRVTATTRMMDERDEGITPIKYFSMADISVGDYVEIDAYRDDAGALVATGVTRDDADSGVQLSGYVDSVTGTTAVIEGVTVDCSAVALPVVGAEAEVHGTWMNGTLTATELSFE